MTESPYDLHDPIGMLQHLVAIDSRNSRPLHTPLDGPVPEAEMCRFLSAHLSELGFECRRQPAASRENLVATREIEPDAPVLAFEAHMDTVGSDGMSIPPLTPAIRDECVFGRGSCDCKGSMAAMLTALRRLVREGFPGNLMFIATCSEETGCEGSPYLDLSAWNVQAAVAGEPTGNRVILGHKTGAFFELACVGVAAHGSHPERGRNAIDAMARTLSVIRTAFDERLGSDRAPQFADGATLSVGTIRGGVKPNIVPERCTASFDLRLLPTQPPARETIDALVADLHAAGCDVDLDWVRTSPGLNQPAESPLATAAARAVQACAGDSAPTTVNYCTDGGVLQRLGVPTIVLGPGDIAQAHGAVEYIACRQVRQAVDIYRGVAFELLSDWKSRAS